MSKASSNWKVKSSGRIFRDRRGTLATCPDAFEPIGPGRLAVRLLWPLLSALVLLGPPVAPARADLLDQGLALLDIGDDAAAEEIFRELAEQHPDAALPHYYVGLAAARRDRPWDAVEAFGRAAEIDPDFPWLQANLGIALFRAGEIERAETHLLEALLQGPEDAQVLLHLGLIDLETEHYQRAIRLFGEAAELEPELAALPWYHAARAQMALGDSGAAEQALERALTAPGPRSAHEAARALRLELDEQRGEGRRWALRAAAGLEYDDNLSVGEADFASGVGDVAGVFELGLDLQPLRQPRAELLVGYDFYQSLYRQVGALNLQSHAPRVELRGAWRGFRPRARYRFRYDSLGGETFLDSHRLNLDVGHQLLVTGAAKPARGGSATPLAGPLPGWYLEVGYELERLAFADFLERDATRQSLRLDQRLDLLGGALHLLLGWQPQWQRARSPLLDFAGHTLRLGAVAVLPIGRRGLDLDAFYSYERRRYDEADRDDTRHVTGATLTLPLAPRVNVALDYMHVNSRSSFPGLTYRENIITFRLGVWL